MIWLAILITVVSSTACSVGKALQKEATRHLPRFSAGDRKILAQYLHSRLWVSGLAADVGGAVLQIAAFALAPVRAGGARGRCWVGRPGAERWSPAAHPAACLHVAGLRDSARFSLLTHPAACNVCT